MGTKKISLIIPTLNEEKTLGSVIDEFTEVLKNHDFEIIVVDSQSKDRTQEIAKKKGARVIIEPRKGYGVAYLTGFNESKGDIIVMTDADGTYDASALPEMLKKMDEAGADMVMGTRLAGNMDKGAMFTLNYIGNILITLLIDVTGPARYTDTQSGFKIIKKKSLDKIKLTNHGWEFTSELALRFARGPFKVEQVPIHYRKREAPTKLLPIRGGLANFKLIMLVFFRLL